MGHSFTKNSGYNEKNSVCPNVRNSLKYTIRYKELCDTTKPLHSQSLHIESYSESTYESQLSIIKKNFLVTNSVHNAFCGPLRFVM